MPIHDIHEKLWDLGGRTNLPMSSNRSSWNLPSNACFFGVIIYAWDIRHSDICRRLLDERSGISSGKSPFIVNNMQPAGNKRIHPNRWAEPQSSKFHSALEIRKLRMLLYPRYPLSCQSSSFMPIASLTIQPPLDVQMSTVVGFHSLDDNGGK